MKYGVITTSQTFIPGDERSRTNPGHGYPEHYQTNTHFTEFDNQDDLKRWIKMNKDENFRVIEFQELQVKTELVIDFKRPGASRLS